MSLTRLRILAAVLLLGSLALPQSTCAGYRTSNGEFVATIPRDVPPAGYEPAVHRDYAFDDFELADPASWLGVALFLWPLPLLAMAARSRALRLRAVVRVLNPILAAVAAYLIWFRATLFSTPASGAYVAVMTLGLYLTTSLIELWRSWRARHAPLERRLTRA